MNDIVAFFQSDAARWWRTICSRVVVRALIGLGFCGIFVSVANPAFAVQVRRGQQEPVRTEFGFDPEDNTPFVDREPFDKIILKDGPTTYTLAVKPLNLPQPIEYQKSGMLRFEMLDRVGQILQVPWPMVTKILTFDEIIIDETRTAFRSGDLDRAFRNLIYLFDHHGKNDPLVVELLDQFWYRDALQLIQSGSFDLAATVLEELYRRNPGFVGDGTPVIELLATEYDRRMRKMAEAVDIDRINAELDLLKRKFVGMPPPIAKVFADWTLAVKRQGEKFLDEAETIAKGEDLIAAHSIARRAIHKLPAESRSWSIYEQVFDRYPAVIVGVTELAELTDIRAADNWAARRVGSLLQKQLVDLVGLGEDGGRYEFADGRIVPIDEFGLAYRLEILPSPVPGQATMSSLELANRLLSLVREGSPEFYFPLAKIVDSIAIIDQSKVEIRLRQPFARFESLLRVPYQTSQSDRGVYSAGESTSDLRMFKPINSTSGQANLPMVERRFASSTAAADALLSGEIDVLDRVFPAELERLRGDRNVVVRPYLIPSIHVLIPNPRTRFMKDQSYRRSFLYAVDRERMVSQVICGGQALQGFSVISGPLPTGSDENDLIGYGYNEKIANVSFNPAMGIISPAVVLKQMRDKARKELLATRAEELDGKEESEQYKIIDGWLNEDPSLREPKLILVHPATEIATATCQAMQQMWAAVGRDVELRALPQGISRPVEDDYDLLYAEFTIEEPLVDLRRVLGELGLAKQVSPTVELLLSELDTARNWVQARQVLRQLHEQCSANATVLPLWQTINFYAYRKNVQGLSESQVRLYDDVQRWSISRRTKD